MLSLQAGAHTYHQRLASQGGTASPVLLRTGDHAAVAAALYESPPYDLQVPALAVARLSVNLAAGQVTGGLAGDRQRRYTAPRFSLYLTPAGADAHWRKDQPSRHLNLYFDPEGFEGDPLDSSRWDPGAPLLNASVPGLGTLARQLEAELAQPGPLAAEAADSLARLMLVQVARHTGALRPAANPLSAAVLGRVRDYAAAHLAERILVQDLARVAGLPVNRFAQAFAAHMGQSPHRWVLALRLQRATELLATSTAGLAEIAAACGFSSQQHLTHTMRLRLGTTPGRYRAVLASIGRETG